MTWQRGPWNTDSTWTGPVITWAGPWLRRAGPWAAHELFRTKTCMTYMYALRWREISSIIGFSFFPGRILWDGCFQPMRHIASTHYSHNPAARASTPTINTILFEYYILVRGWKSRRGENSNFYAKRKRKEGSTAASAKYFWAGKHNSALLFDEGRRCRNIIAIKIQGTNRSSREGRGRRNKRKWLLTNRLKPRNHNTCEMANDRRTQLQLKIRTYTYQVI